MVDPVLLPADQHTYERSAIKGWLEAHGTSPVTGQSLAGKHAVVPNHALRSIISALGTLQT